MRFLMNADDAISFGDDNLQQNIGQLKKKTLKKGTATQRKQDLFFDFMTDLFDVNGPLANGASKGTSKFIDRALVTNFSEGLGNYPA